MGSLPLLIGKFAVSDLQEMMIIERGLFEVPQVIIGGGPQKKTDRGQVRIQYSAPIQCADCKFVVLVLARGKGQIDVDVGRIALQPERY